MRHLVIQKGKSVRTNYILGWVAALSAYICIIPLLIMDLFILQFQFFYFGILGIPKIKRNPFIAIDRHLLKKLGFFQKFNCVYCGYANGMVAFAKAVVNQMEIYSCAIKHLKSPLGHRHHEKFYDRSKFDN